MILRDPQHGVLHVKRLFGTNRGLEAYGLKYSPSQLASEIFKVLRLDCERFLGTSCNRAVVTVPAYFCQAQIDDVREACSLAGLEAVRLVAEPTAACLAAGRYLNYLTNPETSTEHKVAVFDLGGGTFDISIVEVDLTADCHRVFDIRSVDGDCFLGGIDYDQVLIDYCFEKFHERTGISLFQDITAAMRLREAAERAKIELSSTQNATVFVPFIFANAAGTFDLNVQVSRSGFDALTKSLTAKIMECCRRALAESNIGKVDHLLLIGLATRTPSIREQAESLFGVKAATFIDPDSAVAIGAGVQASVLQGTNRSALLLDATPHPIGIRTLGGVASALVDRNTTVPVEKKSRYLTFNSNQDSVLISVWQGHRRLADDNVLLSRFFFDQVTPSGNAQSRISIKIDLDQNHDISVEVIDDVSGRSRRVKVSREPVFEDISHANLDLYEIEEELDEDT